MKNWRWLISGFVLLACATIWAVGSQQVPGQPAARYEAHLGDLDGDGDIDALVIAHGTRLGPASSLWINQGGLQGNTQGKFSPSLQRLGGQAARSAGLGDLDGDGDLDVAVGKAGGFEIYVNSGGPQGGWQGSFEAGQIYAASQLEDLEEITLGDLDSDGDLDILIGLCCSYHAWLNDGSGAFSESGQALGEDAGLRVALGDLDGDADLDSLVVLRGSPADVEDRAEAHPLDQVWLNQGGGRFRSDGQRLGLGGSQAVALGDLDGDGDLDALIASQETRSVWLNDGSARFSLSAELAARSPSRSAGQLPAQAIVLGDLDRDHDLDAVLSTGEVVEVWLNDGRAGFELSAQRIDLGRLSAVGLGDLDGDGDLDLFSGFAAERYRIWWNDGFGRLGLSWR